MAAHYTPRGEVGPLGRWLRGVVNNSTGKGRAMNILLIIIAVIAIILLLTGGFVSSLNFLLWVGIVLLVIAAIVWLVRMLTGSRRV